MVVDTISSEGKRFATALLLLFVAASTLLFAEGASEESSPREIVIGFQAIPNGEIVAKGLGRHEETFDIPIRWVQFNSGSELNSAVASGSVHFGLGGSSTTVAAIAQEVPADVIWIYDIIGDNEALVVREGAGVDSVADLSGLRVAAPFGATTHYHLLVALELNGVDPESVEVLDMAPADILAAWQRGDIDGAFVWEPTLAAMLDIGGEVLVSSRTLAEEGFLTGDIGIVYRGFAEEYPELVEQYVRNQVWAVELIRSDPDRAAAAVAEELGLTPKEARRQMDSLLFLTGEEQLGPAYLGRSESPGGLATVFRETALFLESQGTIREAPSTEAFERVIDPRYLEAAIGE